MLLGKLTHYPQSRYNGGVSNRAYLRVWCRGVTAESLPRLLGEFLETVPFSRVRPGCTQMVVRAVDAAEAPILERDLRMAPLSPTEIVEGLGASLEADSSVELEAWWDLWVYEPGQRAWSERPQRLELVLYGPEFDEGVSRDAGCISVDLGFEHLFTGHAGLLGKNGQPHPAAEHPAEAEFLAHMTRPESLVEYIARTRENILRLKAWVERVAKTLPVEKFVLESEGEADFEGRLEEVMSIE